MAVKLRSLKADMRRQNDGDWVELPELAEASGDIPAIKVRGLNYGPYQVELSAARQRWARKHGSIDGTPPEVIGRDCGRLYAKHLVLDWRGFDEPYNIDTAEEMLTSPGDFFLLASFAVQQVSRTEAEFVENAAKNSPRSSGGSLTTAAK